MAAVLQFEKREKDSRATFFAEGSAEIIIFPGVRFERLDDMKDHDVSGDGSPNGSGPVQHRAAR